MLICNRHNTNEFSYILIEGIQMEIQFNSAENNAYVSNIAFIRALLIYSTIERFSISYEEKEKMKNEILEYLKKT